MAAVHRTAQLAAEAGSQVRETYGAYRTAHDLARHYLDEIVPLRKAISEENQLRYNGMFISVFELLADAREQVASVSQAIEAQRDFWLADAALQAALIGKPAGAVTLQLPAAGATRSDAGH
jgi:outer membrane protein TolC